MAATTQVRLLVWTLLVCCCVFLMVRVAQSTAARCGRVRSPSCFVQAFCQTLQMRKLVARITQTLEPADFFFFSLAFLSEFGGSDLGGVLWYQSAHR